MAAALPRIGVVILNWNGLAHLVDCIPSVLASDHPDFHVVVADNGSTDGSLRWLQENHPGIHCVELGENLRFSAGNNAGARRAIELGAELIFLLNNDTLIDPGCLSELAALFEEDPRMGIAGPRIVFHENPGSIWFGGGSISTLTGSIRHRAIRQPIDSGKDPAGESGWITGCAMMVRTPIWEELGGLDDSYYIYVEDVDFCRRAVRRGWKIRYQPAGMVFHKVSASVGGAFSAFKAFHKTRSKWQFWDRNVSGGRRWILFPSLALQDLALSLWLLMKGSARAAAAVPLAWWDRIFPGGRYRI